MVAYDSHPSGSQVPARDLSWVDRLWTSEHSYWNLEWFQHRIISNSLHVLS
ncbi:hypothetical protein RSAG8_01844, partial [Rhizoctonia solani AG-8 WAC10335]